MNQNLLKNILGSWLGLGTSVLSGLFLTPFIVHRLGPTGFGLWILMTTVTGYYGMLDFGLRSAIIRYVSRDAAMLDWDGVSRTASTTFFVYSIIGSIVVLLTLVVGWKFDTIFHVAPEWRKPGVALLLVMGCGAGVTMPLTLFGGILEGIQKFYAVGVVQTLATILRVGLIILALRCGYGLVTLGLLAVGTNVICNMFYWRSVGQFCPRFHLHWNNVQKAMVGLLFSFGGTTFVISIAQQLRFQMDSIVIGSLLNVELITIFAIGSKLVSYSTDAVQFMAQVFTPMSSHFESRGERGLLQRVLILGNRYASFVILPLASIWLILGKAFILAWIGPAYLSSYRILVILIIPTALYLTQAASTKIMFGMSRHKPLAAVLLAEGIANLGLSVFLLRWYGIEGVALGTAIPMVFTSVVFLPHYVCKLVHLDIRGYLLDSYSYPLIFCAPFTLILWAMGRWVQPHDYVGLLKVLFPACFLYGGELVGYFRWGERSGSFESHVTAEIEESPSSLPPLGLVDGASSLSKRRVLY